MLRPGAILALVLWLTIPLAAQDPARVGHVSVLASGGVIEVEIQTSGAVTPQSQMLAGPDRIVVDFPGALPGNDLRATAVNRGALKAIRTALFSRNPSVTRVVLDLAAPQTYQVFATRNAVVLKLSPIAAAVQAPQSPGSSSSTVPPPVSPPQPAMNVTFHNGMLRIHADRVTLAQVLFEVQRQTGAEIAIPAGAESEEIAAELGPAPAREVLASLLNGSRYNFIFVGNDSSHTLRKAILSVR
jgi:hypothetical protein